MILKQILSMILALVPSVAVQVTATRTDDSLAAARQSIGKLTCRQGARIVASTAALISDRKTLLTVAHFNQLPDGSEVAPERCRFSVSDGSSNGNESSLEFSVRHVGGDWFHNRLSRATDWAILELNDELPLSHVPLDIAEESGEDRRNVQMAGFAAVTARKVAWSVDRDCSLQSDRPDSAIINHDCASGPGTSGSPILQRKGVRLEIVGMHVGRTETGGLAVRVSKIAPLSPRRRAV